MKLSAKTDYACRALLELCMHWPSPTPVQITVIAEKQKIPIKFLTQILLDLKQMGLVESWRGKKGGYILSKPPAEIRLNYVVEHFMDKPAACSCEISSAKMFHTIWCQTDQEILKYLGRITFEDLCNKELNSSKVPMYNI